jgi:hypothetical protein
MKKNSTFITVIIILIAVGMIITYSSIFTGGRQTNTQPAQPAPTQESSIQAKIYSYQGEQGKTALEILKSKFDVETKETDFGEMVTAIEGKKADESKEFWAFKVNGEMAMEGAGTYQTKDTDQISWELTEIR